MRRQPKQARAKEKVARILDAARDLMVREGGAALTTNRIAAEAGVGIGSLYEYFPDKQSIVNQLIEDLSSSESQHLLARLALLDGAGPGELIDETVSLVFDLYVQNHALYRELWALSSEPRIVGHRPGESQIMGGVMERLSEHQHQLGITDLTLTCFTIFHLVESLANRMVEQGLELWSAETCKIEIARVVRRYLTLPDST
jgi:AcrR family transcriptional regulator